MVFKYSPAVTTYEKNSLKSVFGEERLQCLRAFSRVLRQSHSFSILFPFELGAERVSINPFKVVQFFRPYIRPRPVIQQAKKSRATVVHPCTFVKVITRTAHSCGPREEMLECFSLLQNYHGLEYIAWGQSFIIILKLFQDIEFNNS